MNEIYQIVYSDQASDLYSFGVPNGDNPLFKSVSDAKRGLEAYVHTFTTFRAVAYGQAYPYDTTSFEKELQTKGHAMYGWVTNDEGAGESFSIILLKLRLC